MDGLEISEIKFSEMFFENRLDSEYFLKDILIKDAILDKLASITIGSFSYVTDGIHESIEFDDKSNVNLISAKAPKKNYFDLSGTGFISKSQNEQNPRTQLKYNDIIVSTVGTIGNCAVVNEEVLPANSDRHVGIVRLNSDSVVKPRYLSTFILSKYGQYQTKRFTTGNVQPNLFIYKIKDIKVPVISNLWQDKIEGLVLQAEELLKDSKKCYKLAEKLLMDKLNIKIYSTDLVSIKTLAESLKSSGRLDAEYYQPKYEEYEKIITQNKGGYTYVKKEFDMVSEKCSRLLKEYPYVEIGDIDVGNGIATSNIILTEELPDNAKIMTKANDVLVSTVRPNRGAVAILEQDNLLVSGAFTVLREKGNCPKEVLQVLLRSEMYRDWMLRYNVGTSYPVIKDDDILNLPIPILDEELKKEIVNNVQESSKLRKKAKKLLDIAVQAVEMAIETDEQTALAWIKAQCI